MVLNCPALTGLQNERKTSNRKKNLFRKNIFNLSFITKINLKQKQKVGHFNMFHLFCSDSSTTFPPNRSISSFNSFFAALTISSIPILLKASQPTLNPNSKVTFDFSLPADVRLGKLYIENLGYLSFSDTRNLLIDDS